MYAFLLALHSLTRWLVLISLLVSIFLGFYGWRKKQPFGSYANRTRHITATIAHIQLVLGICLYVISPLTEYFRTHFSEAVHERAIRFFGMEHALMMLVGITVITIGSVKVKRTAEDTLKYKRMAIWYLAGLLIILSSVPWQFSPLVSRPYFRAF
ncbi:MAG: hypothetical protein QM743_02790 [Chitinophagaceae bacterium]